MSKPLIGVGVDYDIKKEKDGGYSDYPWYALRVNYTDAVANNGGIPVLIPYREDLINYYISLCDGFVFPGGEYDIDPSYYGAERVPETTVPNDARTRFEMKLIKAVLRSGKPILGICAGEQMLNIILGGTLYQDINTCIKTNIDHKPGDMPRDKNRHYIEVSKESLLHKIVGKTKYKINSHHHQAVWKLGKGLKVSAVAPDGVVEAIELPRHKFCLGVQWHPEYEKNKEDSLIFKSMINAAKKLNYCVD
jgi:putative glutamine amidotransferase